MADENWIVCVNRADTSPGHRHITHAGTGSDPDQASAIWTIAQVRARLNAGERFYTVSFSNGIEADVEPFDCSCGVETIRSNPDAAADNNLDRLRECGRTRMPSSSRQA